MGRHAPFSLPGLSMQTMGRGLRRGVQTLECLLTAQWAGHPHFLFSAWMPSKASIGCPRGGARGGPGLGVACPLLNSVWPGQGGSILGAMIQPQGTHWTHSGRLGRRWPRTVALPSCAQPPAHRTDETRLYRARRTLVKLLCGQTPLSARAHV